MKASQNAGRARGHGPADSGLQIPSDLTALSLHPEDHPGQDDCGQGHGHSLEDLFGPSTEPSPKPIERQRRR
jgi:hypothetical protein